MDRQETEKLVGEFQVYQQQLQGLLLQKESLSLQLAEIAKVDEELNVTKQKTAYKITGGIMVSKPVEEIKKDLAETKEAIEVRVKSLEKAEEKVNLKLKELQTKLKEIIQ